MERFKLYFCLLCSIFATVSFNIQETTGSQESKLLYDKLFQNYNKLSRPVQNESQNVTVTFGITLFQIIELNEKAHVLTSLIWLRLNWNDYYLKWNESDYGNISSLRVPIDRIWLPDIYAYNSASDAIDSSHHGTKAVLHSDGNITYIPPGVHSTTCQLDLTNYPMDEQKCEIKFGSWTHNGREVNLVIHSKEGADISSFKINPEWDLIGAPVKRTVKTYTCCEEPYIDITYTIHIQRRGNLIYLKLHAWNLVNWTIVLLGFFHHPSSQLKLCFPAGSIILSFWIISNLSFLAKTGKYPWTYFYFIVQFWINLFGLGANVLTCYFYNKTGPCYEWLIGLTNSKIAGINCPTRKNLVSNRLNNISSNADAEQTSREGINNDWKYFSMFLDRVFSMIFVIIITIVNFTLFP